MSTPRRSRPPTRTAAASSPALTVLLTLLSVLCALAAPAHALPAVAGVGAGVGLVTATGAAGEVDGTDGADGGTVDVRITRITPDVVRPADEVVVRALVHNGTDAALEAPHATLRISRYLQSTRSALERWADLPLDGTAGTPVGISQALGPLAPGQSAEVELRVPATELGLSTADSAWGPRGISVAVADDGRRRAIVRTFLVWQPSPQPVAPVLLSVLVPVTGGPVDPTAPAPGPGAGQTGAGTASDQGAAPDAGDPPASQDAGTGEADLPDGPGPVPDGGLGAPVPHVAGAPSDAVLGRLRAALDATAGQPGVAWAVDPALLSAARAAGGTAAGRWVDALTESAADREVVALPAGDPDLAALAHADSPAADGLLATAIAAATAAQDPALGPTVRADLAWPAGASADLDTAALAARTGAASMVISGAALPPEHLTYTPTGRATVETADGTVSALVTDPVLSAQLQDPSGTTAATAAQRMLAETAVVARERPNDQRHLLAAVDRAWHPDPAIAAAQLAAVADAPWVELTPLSVLAGTADPGVDRPTLPARAVDDDEIAPGSITALQRARDELAQLATIVPDPAALLAGVDDTLRIPLSVAWRADPVRRAAVVDALVAGMAGRRAGVSVLPGSDLSLISETGLFPLGLRNDLPQEVTVQVAVDAASPLLVVDEPQTVTIPPATETQVRVPFHAVGSGDVRVAVSLRTPTGVPLGPPQEFTVRVRADWENVGTAVVAGLLAVAFVVGIVRTIRRGQTASRGAGATPVSEIARLPEESA